MTWILACAEAAVRLAMKKGFDEAEAFGTEITKREVIYRNKIEAAKTSVVAGLSVRGVLGKRIGFFSTSSLKGADIETTVEHALRIAKASDEDPDWRSLTQKYGKASVERVFDNKVDGLSAKDLIDEVRLALDTVREVDASLDVTKGYITSNVLSNAIANSHGCKLERKETFVGSWLSVKAGSSEQKGVAHEIRTSRLWRGLRTEEIARIVSERALKMVKATHLASGKMNTVWRNDAYAGTVDAVLTRTITADAVQRNRSPWVGKVGQTVASEGVSVIDEGKMMAGVGTRQFDDDGTPQERTPVIEKGVLRGFLYDNYTAGKEKRLSTGNAHRDVGTFFAPLNYTRTPSPYPNNLVVKPGDASADELIKETRNGLYIVETIGEWLSNPISGELTATVASGFLIENGELTKAVKGAIVSASLFEMLKGKMDLRANDLENSGPVYAPTTQVLDMTVAGE